MSPELTDTYRPVSKVLKKMKATLVGVAGSHNAFSLSLYNLKAYAYRDSQIREQWEINVIQRPLIGVWQRDKLLSELTDEIVAQEPNLVGFSCYMWNIQGFLEIAEMIYSRLPSVRILLGGPEIATECVKNGVFLEKRTSRIN